MDIPRFSDFSEEPKTLEGDKIKIDDLLNIEVIINAFVVSESQYQRQDQDQYARVQVVIDDTPKVFFTGSGVLISQLQKYQDKMPFVATIKKVNKYYTLS